jgi:hypothetical protein
MVPPPGSNDLSISRRVPFFLRTPCLITIWRWDRGDRLPNGRLSQIRAALEREALDLDN